MRKKLALIVLALAAFTAASVPTSATVPTTSPCPAGTHLFTCPDRTFCCPNGAFCICKQS